jgi:hypothetical protein
MKRRDLILHAAAFAIASSVVPGAAWAKSAHGDGNGNNSAGGNGNGNGPGNNSSGGNGNGNGPGASSAGGNGKGNGSGNGPGNHGSGGNPRPGNAPGHPAGPAGTPKGLPDNEVARRAVKSGAAKPLAEIIETAKKTNPGEILDARLVTVRGFLLYELKVLSGHTVRKIYFYARSGLPVSSR